MQIYGNQSSQDRLRALLSPTSRVQTIVLAGPSHIGKASFATMLISELLEESDFTIVDSGIAGSRKAASFLSLEPTFSSYRIVMVDRAESMSEPAQDAYLKLCEEPPGAARIIFITSDDKAMLPALRSRIQEVIRWASLTEVEIETYTSSLDGVRDLDAEEFCLGRPGLYLAMAGDRRFKELFEAAQCLASGHGSFDLPVPEAIKSLEGKASPRRTAVAEVCRIASKTLVGDSFNRLRCASILRFSSSILRHPSANAEVYWQRAVVSCLL